MIKKYNKPNPVEVVIPEPVNTISSSINTRINSITNIQATTGSNNFVGTQTITGSLQISGSLYYNGHKQYNYGQFYDMTSQSGSSGSIQSMKLNTTDLSEGVSIVSGSQIKVENAGVYNLQFSAQLENTVNTNIVFNIWFAKNGNSIPNSNTHVEVARAQSAQLGKVPAAWNFLSHLNDNDYYSILYDYIKIDIILILNKIII